MSADVIPITRRRARPQRTEREEAAADREVADAIAFDARLDARLTVLLILTCIGFGIAIGYTLASITA